MNEEEELEEPEELTHEQELLFLIQGAVGYSVEIPFPLELRVCGKLWVGATDARVLFQIPRSHLPLPLPKPFSDHEARRLSAKASGIARAPKDSFEEPVRFKVHDLLRWCGSPIWDIAEVEPTLGVHRFDDPEWELPHLRPGVICGRQFSRVLLGRALFVLASRDWNTATVEFWLSRRFEDPSKLVVGERTAFLMPMKGKLDVSAYARFEDWESRSG